MKKGLWFGVILVIIILVFLFISQFLGIFRDKTNQITEDEARKIAISKAYEGNQYALDLAKQREAILNVEKRINGDYVVQVCDYNIECICREDEGYWIKVKYDGTSSEVIKTNLCPFG